MRPAAYTDNLVTLYQGDCRDVLAEMEPESVHMVITSPPYWGLRSYSGDQETTWADGWCGALGLEPTLGLYVEHIVEVFRAAKHVLRKDGTVFMNLGDVYASGKGTCRNPGGGESSLGQNRKEQGVHPLDRGNKSILTAQGLKPKDLCMLPARVAIALQADGWWIRSMMPWVKRGPMPESTTDRPTSALEYMILMTKADRYFFDMDAVRVAHVRGTFERAMRAQTDKHKNLNVPGRTTHSMHAARASGEGICFPVGGRAFRNTDLFYQSVSPPHGMIFAEDEMVGLDVNTEAFPEAHFAVFPRALCTTPILAGTSERGCCPECGAGWVRVVEKSGGTIGRGWHNHENDKIRGHRDESGGRSTDGSYKVQTLGWKPGCSCYDGRDWSRADMRRTRNVRKREQQDATGLWRARITRIAAMATVPATVLDPFAGSATALLRAKELGRRAIGIELSEEYCQIAARRLSGQLTLEGE